MEKPETSNHLPVDHPARVRRALLSLNGLSVGDAFGEHFFGSFGLENDPRRTRVAPSGPWYYTDDTAMAISVVRCLDRRGRIDPDALALLFTNSFTNNPYRGYGPMAIRILMMIRAGEPWKSAAGMAFNGKGSMGNGSAMRIAPLGAYFADDIPRLVEEARLSAVVTHAHPEGAAGAIAVAAAAAWAWNHRETDPATDSRELIRFAAQHTPEGATRAGIEKALSVPFSASVREAAETLGSGLQTTNPDTVPFTLWCAARHWKNYADALWAGVDYMGDLDTNCAIIGGIVALSAGPEAIPADWLRKREALKLDPEADHGDLISAFWRSRA